jgi:putative ABC transport system ATP-binding protein
MMPHPNQIIVSAHALTKRVATVEGVLEILSDVSLQIKTAESVAVIGVSGSGKSTLLGLLAGLDVPSSGSITLGPYRLNDLDEDGRARVRAELVGFVFQAFQLLPSLTALENVMLPLELAGQRNPESQVRELLARVGLAERLQHYPRQLSGGEQQRVAIARALINKPELILADEPTGNLDSHTGEGIIDLLASLREERNATLLIATHDTHVADRAPRSIELVDGQIHL